MIQDNITNIDNLIEQELILNQLVMKEFARIFFFEELPEASEQDFEVSWAKCDGNWADVVIMYQLGEILKRQND